MSSTTSTSDDWASLATINSEFKELLKTYPPNFQLVTETTTIPQLRAMGENAMQSAKWPEVLEREITITVRDGHQNQAIVYSPAKASEKGPLFLAIHGGGFCVGKPEQEEENCRNWVVDHAGVAVSIQYRLGPETAFAVPVYDAYDALKWVASSADELGADLAKGFILGGTSSGATYAIISSLLYRDDALSPPLTGVYLTVPGSCVPGALPEPYASDPRVVSREQNADAPIFNVTALKLFAASYPTPPDSPLRSPLLWPSGHAGLPKTYFQIAGLDPLRDYGLVYEESLRKHGVKTRLDVFPGLVHGFWGLFPKANFTKDFREKSKEGFRWLLATD